jgi:RNA polymerase sigma-70 factor (ECF subfamily)
VNPLDTPAAPRQGPFCGEQPSRREPLPDRGVSCAGAGYPGRPARLAHEAALRPRRREPGRGLCVQLRVQVIVNRTAHKDDLSDAELVQRAQRGVPAAFAELVSRYQDRVFNTCYRMCHNHADAADLTQSTFLKALEALPGFRGRSSFFTWLFRIAVNLTLSHRRAQRRRPPWSLSRPAGDGQAPEALIATDQGREVSRPAEQRELRQRIEWALAQLDEEFRAAVVLKDIEDMDYASIAEIFDVPVGTVKSRIHRGRLMLRALLQDERVAPASRRLDG